MTRPPSPPDLFDRYERAGGTYLVCPISFNARKLDADRLLKNVELGGTVPMWQWTGRRRRVRRALAAVRLG